VQGAATKRTLLLGQIKMYVRTASHGGHALADGATACRATANLYALIQKKSKVAHIEGNPLLQLEKIQHYINDLQDITANFQHAAEQGLDPLLDDTLPLA
jgi:hypothetical protein